MTVEEFIQKHLIKEIGEIKTNYPYLAFVLMAVGIEFLGKCQNSNPDWNKSGSSEMDFNSGLTLFNNYDTLYKSMNLYKELRCGLAHALLTNGTLLLSDHGQNTNNCLSCEAFYNDFVSACEYLIAHPEKMPEAKRGKPFFTVTETKDINIRTSGGTTSQK